MDYYCFNLGAERSDFQEHEANGLEAGYTAGLQEREETSEDGSKTFIISS